MATAYPYSISARTGDVLDGIAVQPANAQAYVLGNTQGLTTSAEFLIAVTEVIVSTGNWFGNNVVVQVTLKSASSQVVLGAAANASNVTSKTYTNSNPALAPVFTGTTISVPVSGGGTSQAFTSLNVAFQ